MKCRICNSPDAKLYYHAVCCRACAAFFRRTIQTKKRYICSKDNSCDVTHSNRYSCRFCRMKKCRSIGMSLKLGDPSTSSDGGETSNDVLELQLDNEKASSQEFYSIDNVFEDYENFLEAFRERISNSFKKDVAVKEVPHYLTMCQQICVFFKQFEKKWPNCRKETLDHNNCANVNKLICKIFNVADDGAELCMKMKPFAGLPMDQKAIVFKHFAARFQYMFVVFSSVKILGNDINDTRLISVTGKIYDYNVMDNNEKTIATLQPEELRGIKMILSTTRRTNRIFLQPFKRLEADEFEKSYLLAMAIWFLEGVQGLTEETIRISEKVRETLAEELHYYYKYIKSVSNYAGRIYKMQNLVRALDRNEEWREHDMQLYNTFKLFKVNVELNEMISKIAAINI